MPHQTLDPTQLQSWRDLLPDAEKTSFIRTLIDNFLLESACRLTDLQAAVQADDSVACRSVAHRLQGICSVIGARRLTDLCAELEPLTEAHDRTGFGQQLVQIQEEYARVTQALVLERP